MQLVSARTRLDLSSPAVMGILNVTPDSFSDGGDWTDVGKAVDHALAMLEAGAGIVDIGAESTRPGAVPVPAAEQSARLLPVLTQLRAQTDAFLSVDTGNADVIRAAADAGADMINDVYALQQPGALDAAAESGLALGLMHMQGEPATMQDDPRYDDLTGEVLRFLRARAGACVEAGVDANRIVVDPGFGFGKTDDHNLGLLADLGCFRELGFPLLVGWSRKGTLGAITGRPVEQRLPGSLAAAVLAVESGAHIVRVHDVPETVDALKIVSAVAKAGMQGGPAG